MSVGGGFYIGKRLGDVRDPIVWKRLCEAYSLGEKTMHYRNGRVATNGDKIIQLEGGKVTAFGTLQGAQPGNDYCNGVIQLVQSPNQYACLCDCVHVDDLAELLTQAGLDKRPAGK